MSECPWRLVVCDLDGTLITGTTALEHLRGWLGHPTLIEDLEEQFVGGHVSDREVAEAYAPFYKGVALAEAVRARSCVPSIDHIQQGVSMLRRRSVDVSIATVSWSFAARALAEAWGFSQACGADLEIDEASGLFTGRVARHLGPEDKVAWVADHCRRTGIGMTKWWQSVTADRTFRCFRPSASALR